MPQSAALPLQLCADTSASAVIVVIERLDVRCSCAATNSPAFTGTVVRAPCFWPALAASDGRCRMRPRGCAASFIAFSGTHERAKCASVRRREHSRWRAFHLRRSRRLSMSNGDGAWSAARAALELRRVAPGQACRRHAGHDEQRAAAVRDHALFLARQSL